MGGRGVDGKGDGGERGRELLGGLWGCALAGGYPDGPFSDDLPNGRPEALMVPNAFVTAFAEHR